MSSLRHRLLMVAVSGLLGPGAVVGQVKVPRVAETPGVARLTGSNPAQWRLIWTDNPQTKVTVSWSTAKKGSRHRVYYDTASHKGKRLTTYRHQQKTLRDGQHSVGIDPRPSELHYHHAVLDKLQPSTTYYFTIASGRSRSPEFRFVTAPADDRPFSIVFGGDSRTDIQGRRRVNRFLSELIGKNDDILAFAHGGDFVTTGTSLAQWSAWLSDHELTATRDGRMIPIIPTRGNHEAGAPQFDEVFNAPGGVGRNYYTTMLGPKVLFVTLNTEIAMTGDQRKFLAAQLLALQAAERRVPPLGAAVRAAQARHRLRGGRPCPETHRSHPRPDRGPRRRRLHRRGGPGGHPAGTEGRPVVPETTRQDHVRPSCAGADVQPEGTAGPGNPPRRHGIRRLCAQAAGTAAREKERAAEVARRCGCCMPGQCLGILRRWISGRSRP
ncbi:MAG: fibronectin type III domain-containing protein [Planctomycetota bacterium]